MNSTMTILKIMPGRKPEKITIPHTLDEVSICFAFLVRTNS